jgi:hypothetical protein
LQVLVRVDGGVLPQHDLVRVAPLRAQRSLHHRLRHLARERQPERVLLQHSDLPVFFRPAKHARALPLVLAVLHGAGSAAVSRREDAKTPRHEALHRQSFAGLFGLVLDPDAHFEVRPRRGGLPQVGDGRRHFRHPLEGKALRSSDAFSICRFQTSFMLLLLLLAKGWAVTRLELSWKPLVFAIWLCYGIVHILLYVWNLVRHPTLQSI